MLKKYMRKCLFLILVFPLFFGCQPEKKGEDLEKGEDQKPEVVDTLSKGEGRFKGEDERINTADEKPEADKPPGYAFPVLISLPKRWVVLKTVRNDTVVFVPCAEGRAAAVRILDETTSQPKLEVLTPKEVKQYLILKADSEKGGMLFSVLRYYEKELGTPSETEDIILKEVKKGVYAVSGSPFNKEKELTMIGDEKITGNYKVVRESCK